MPTIWAFDYVEKKAQLISLGRLYEKFLWMFKRARVKNSFEKKKILPLTKEGLRSYKYAKLCYVCGKRLLKKFANDKNYQKVRDECHYTGNI